MPFPARSSSTDDYPLHSLSKRTSFSTHDMVSLGEAGPSLPIGNRTLARTGGSGGYGKGKKKRLSDVDGEGESLLGTGIRGEEDGVVGGDGPESSPKGRRAVGAPGKIRDKSRTIPLPSCTSTVTCY